MQTYSRKKVENLSTQQFFSIAISQITRSMILLLLAQLQQSGEKYIVERLLISLIDGPAIDATTRRAMYLSISTPPVGSPEPTFFHAAPGSVSFLLLKKILPHPSCGPLKRGQEKGKTRMGTFSSLFSLEVSPILLPLCSCKQASKPPPPHRSFWGLGSLGPVAGECGRVYCP